MARHAELISDKINFKSSKLGDGDKEKMDYVKEKKKKEYYYEGKIPCSMKINVTFNWYQRSQ